jgi:diacylglycerol kinase family enzyme
VELAVMRAKKPSNTAVVLINPGSGTVRTLGRDAVEAAVKAHLDDAFTKLDVEFLEGNFEKRLKQVAASDAYQTIIVGGGDGTINAAAALLTDTGKIMGALPLGTLNLFVRALGFDTDLGRALDQLRDAKPKRVDVGIVNDRIFLHQVSLGLQPRVAKLRERYGYRSRFSKIYAGLRAFAVILFNPKSVRLKVEVDGEPRKLRVPLVVISNNRLGEGQTLFLQKSLDRGELGLYVLRDASPRHLFKIARAYLANRLADLDMLDATVANRLTITPRNRFGRRRKRITASLDGEVLRFDTPLEISIKPQSLNVLVPVNQPSP